MLLYMYTCNHIIAYHDIYFHWQSEVNHKASHIQNLPTLVLGKDQEPIEPSNSIGNGQIEQVSTSVCLIYFSCKLKLNSGSRMVDLKPNQIQLPVPNKNLKMA